MYIRKGSTGERIITVGTTDNDTIVYIRPFVIERYFEKDPESKGVYTKLRDRLNSVPDSRCIYQSECINHVKPGLKNIYLEVRNKKKILKL